jgi:hypothetical protein
LVVASASQVSDSPNSVLAVVLEPELVTLDPEEFLHQE